MRAHPRTLIQHGAIRAEIRTTYSWDWEGAAYDIEKATELGGGVWTDYAAARLAGAIGDILRARQIYQRAITTNPFDADAMVDMGYFVEMQAGNFELAESWMRRAL